VVETGSAATYEAMLGLIQTKGIKPIADEADARLRRALERA